jgi:hypothetical protein
MVILLGGLLAGSGMAYPPSNQGKPFYMGVYLYEYHLARTAQELNQDYFAFLEHHLKILQDHGVNAVYLGGASRDRFEREVKLFARYGISVIPQLDFAYYQPKWDDKTMAATAKRAADFINRFADEPNVLAFSVREELPHEATNGLARYYAAILADAPKARFQLINSNLGTATDLPVPDPVIMGTDRYAFWWEFSGGGYLASPGFSLNWVREQADRYYWQSARRGADFSLVVTQGGAFVPAGANKYAGDGALSKPEQEKMRHRVRSFAAAGRMGWGQFDTPEGKRYNVWKYYRLPENCMRALAWTAVLQGGRSFYVWSYSPLGPDKLKVTFQNAAMGEKIPSWGTWTTLAGRPGRPNPQFDEFTETAKEIRPYEKLITRMSRTGESLIQCDQKGVFHNAFMAPGVSGRIVVIQNSNVGTWPGNSAQFFKDSDDVRIDDDGNLVGYQPAGQPLEVHFTVKDGKADVFDVRTGAKLPQSGGKYTARVGPGSGILVFIGTEQAAQALRAGM